MKELLNPAIALVIIGVITVIGAAIMIQTTSVTTSAVGNETDTSLLTSVSDSAGSGLQTFTAFLPILAMVVIGGLALAYLINFVGRGE